MRMEPGPKKTDFGQQPRGPESVSLCQQGVSEVDSD